MFLQMNTTLPWFPESSRGNIIRTVSLAMFLEASSEKPYLSFFNTLSISLTKGEGAEGKLLRFRPKLRGNDSIHD
ncbi:hypothetical protein VNO78_01098 [Psophocarpus tetragonolobus]|uniref:Uncharacterized protein n=1 Tax=Psophocarpus tetragonolobus TaxID=3891 RepID=A0AAN9T195_PSOTE